jgi:hypothetical protein
MYRLATAHGQPSPSYGLEGPAREPERQARSVVIRCRGGEGDSRHATGAQPRTPGWKVSWRSEGQIEHGRAAVTSGTKRSNKAEVSGSSPVRPTLRRPRQKTLSLRSRPLHFSPDRLHRGSDIHWKVFSRACGSKSKTSTRPQPGVLVLAEHASALSGGEQRVLAVPDLAGILAGVDRSDQSQPRSWASRAAAVRLVAPSLRMASDR